jgi:ribonucleoside-diphosphate reductase beta chain
LHRLPTAITLLAPQSTHTQSGHVTTETAAADLLEQGVSGMSLADTREYLQHVDGWRLAQLGIEPVYGSKNPFAFMELQDVQELSNFFERKVSACQVGVTGSVRFDDDF